MPPASVRSVSYLPASVPSRQVIIAAARATAIPNGNGGFTLVTTAGSIEQALVRFDRSGRHECPGAYTLSEPPIIHGGFGATFLGSTSRLTVQATLLCRTTP
jgi:hypothetical protein